MSKRLSHHLVTFLSPRHYLSYPWTYECTHFQNFSDFKIVIGFQKQRVFQTIPSNFNFYSLPPSEMR